MLAYRDGDAAAFESLYLRHKDGLFAFLYQSCGHMTVVEEVAQDAWTAVIHAAPRYHARGQFRTYLYQIGRNRLRDYWRRKDNQHAPLSDAPEPTTGSAQTSGDTGELMTAISRLGGDQRDAVLLQAQGFSLADIAEITDVGTETVKSRLRYARRQLRHWLDDEPGADHD